MRVSESVVEVRNTASESAVAQRSPGRVTCLGETMEEMMITPDHAG